MHPPEQCAGSLFRSLVETQIVELHFPLKSVAFTPEGRFKGAAIRVIPLPHKELKEMSRNHLVIRRIMRERSIVAPHTHLTLLVSHRVRRVGHTYLFSASEERIHQLTLGSHHDHAPRLICQRRYCDHVMLLYELRSFNNEFADQLRLLTGSHMHLLHVFKSFVPIVAITHLPRSLQHLLLTPIHFSLSNRDQLFRR